MRTVKTDQTERTPRLIPVFLGRKVIVFVLSCCGPHDKVLLQKLRVLGEEKNYKKLIIVTMANLEIQCTSFRNYHQVNYTFDKWSDASFAENIS